MCDASFWTYNKKKLLGKKNYYCDTPIQNGGYHMHGSQIWIMTEFKKSFLSVKRNEMETHVR